MTTNHELLERRAKLSVSYSHNFATAKPDIGATEKEHILGLCVLVTDLAAALSQTAGVAEGFVAVPKDDLQTVVRIAMEGRAPFHSEARPALRRFAAMLAAAPAASGGECNCASGRGAEHCIVHAHAAWDAPQPPDGAPVSERARTLFNAMLSAPYGDTTMGNIVCAETTRNRLESAWLPILEQALTQQRGDGEVVDRDAWAEALELPQGYTVEEFLPGGWHYAWTRADGERMVSGTTWNHPALAAIAAWQYAPATTPQPGAEALRELVQRWREVAKSTFSRRTAEMYTHFADELESLLARGAE